MKYTALFILLICSIASMGQTPPGWLNPLIRNSKFPPKKFYTGFASISFQKGQDISMYPDKLKSASRITLSESIFIIIQSESNSLLKNTNGTSENRYTKSTITKSSLEAIGLKSEIYIDQKERVGYGFSYVERASLVSHYSIMLSEELSSIEESLEQNGTLSDDPQAYSRLMNNLTALERLKEYQDMLRYLDVYSQEIILTDAWRALHSEIVSELSRLKNKEDIDLEEVAYFFADKVKAELTDGSDELGVQPITYKNTGISTEFSDYFDQILTQALESRFGSVAKGLSNDGVVVTGTYWPGEDEIKVILNANQLVKGEIVKLQTGSSMAVKKSSFNELDINISIPIEKSILEKNKLLQPVESEGGLLAEVSTQKGKESVIFQEGELLELFVNVSRPSYLRILNVWSDNQSYLLADNYYISPVETDQKIKIPMSWETSCPCGVEFIQVIASDKILPPLTTTKVDGFDKINGDLKQTISQSRGFKKTGNQYAESTIIVTTIPQK
jgi:hypothetical protein